MADSTENPPLVDIAKHLLAHDVEFIVIGGMAAVLFGSPIPTFDVDLCYRRTADNLARLAKALSEIHPTLRDAPPDLPFRMDAESLALGSNFTFQTDFGPLDLLGWVEPIGMYEGLLPKSISMSLGDIKVQVIGLDDLIRIKRHLSRPKDQGMLHQLEELRRLQNESG